MEWNGWEQPEGINERMSVIKSVNEVLCSCWFLGDYKHVCIRDVNGMYTATHIQFQGEMINCRRIKRKHQLSFFSFKNSFCSELMESKVLLLIWICRSVVDWTMTLLDCYRAYLILRFLQTFWHGFPAGLTVSQEKPINLVRLRNIGEAATHLSFIVLQCIIMHEFSSFA